MAQTALAPTRTVSDLSRALAEAFRTGEVDGAFTADVLLDGHPPFWRFQLEGLDALASWLAEYTRHRPRVTVLRTVATATGFVAEHASAEESERGLLTSRKILLCDVRDGRICALTVYCDGDWDEELRARHASEAPMVRP